MKCLINAYSLNSAGGKNVCLNFLNNLDYHRDVHFYLFVKENNGYEKFRANENIEVIYVPNILTNYLFRFYLEWVWFRIWANKLEPDVIFSMTNIALPIANIKQGLLFHNSYYVYPEYKNIWRLLDIRSRIMTKLQIIIFKNRLKYAHVIFPQTNVIKNRLQNIYNAKNLQVVPNAYVQDLSKSSDKVLFNKDIKFKYLLCLSKYYPHKNLEIFVEVSKIIKENNYPFKIVLTINPNIPKAYELLKVIKAEGLENICFNAGELSQDEIGPAYQLCDGLLLPTLLESFSATYVDALVLGKPVFTSNLDFAIEVCGDVAYYFDPHSPISIVGVIKEAFQNPGIMQFKKSQGLSYSKLFLSSKQTTNLYIEHLKKLVTSDFE